MAEITVQKIVSTGIAPTFSPATVDGDIFKNDGATFIHVKNGGASPITLTINSLVKCNHGFDHDLVITIPNAGERIIGPLETTRFNDSSEKASLTYSAVTSVTLAVYKMN